MESLAERLSRIRVVLVEPRYDGNLGHVARAMLNFGLTRLYLAGGQADPASREARWYARDEGEAVLDRAIKVDTLDQALGGCDLILGTSRRLGRGRMPGEPPDSLFPEVAPWKRPGETALLFGREAHGLRTDELDRCQRLIWIPTDPAGPSLNVAQAVALTGYALSQAARKDLACGPARQFEAAPSEDLEAMFQHARRVWLRIGYLNHQNPDAILRRWRTIFGRSQLSAGEVRVIRALVHQIDWAAGRAGLPPGGVAEAPPGTYAKHVKPTADSGDEDHSEESPTE